MIEALVLSQCDRWDSHPAISAKVVVLKLSMMRVGVTRKKLKVIHLIVRVLFKTV